MLRRKVERLIILALLLVYVTVFVRPVSAGVPAILDVTVWDNGGNTILNVTVSHSPQTPSHYLDRVEIDLSGDNRIFPVTYRSENTFVVQCDLGAIDAPINATIRAHCNIDGYSPPNGPILVPEFSALLVSFLFITATLLTSAVYKRKSDHGIMCLCLSLTRTPRSN
ncbi:hypothetical protein KEJ15_06460 [Candidatus Bathyarchaeota archaeon]|nr:hypothetical protein [Candidatus Bathyarchaeota archaeon]